MPDENKVRDAAEAIKGIVEAVPVYQDLVQPAAKEIGIGLQTMAKTIHIALAPISALVWGYDEIKDYIYKALIERLKDLPQERIITPNPAVAGPTVEALRFTAHDSTLRELFANLLSTAMDADSAKEAHPAFVEMLRQLTSDEARLIDYVYQEKYLPGYFVPHPPLISGIVEMLVETAMGPGWVNYDLRHFSLLAEKAGCLFTDSTPSYIDNLCRLGLVEISRTRQEEMFDAKYRLYVELEKQAELSALEYCRKRYPNSRIEETERRNITMEELKLTSWGKQFCKACIIEARA